MIRERNGLSYHEEEQEFVKFFNRLKDIGKTFDEIEAILPQINDYYYEMVIVPKYRKTEPSLEILFKEWKYSIEHPF